MQGGERDGVFRAGGWTWLIGCLLPCSCRPKARVVGSGKRCSGLLTATGRLRFERETAGERRQRRVPAEARRQLRRLFKADETP